MLNIQERVDKILLEAEQMRFDFAQPAPKTRGAASRVSGPPGQSASAWSVGPNKPAVQVQPVQERVPLTNEQMAERIANDVLKEIRPKLHTMAEGLRQTVFKLRPDLGQMISTGWNRLKDFWKNWTGGTKESLVAYKILSEYITRLYEADLPQAAPPQGFTEPNYNVARQAQFPRPGYEGPGWQPNPYSVHDTISMFLKDVEGLFYDSIKTHVLAELNKRPSTYQHEQNKKEFDRARQKLKWQIEDIRVRQKRLKYDLQARINYERELKQKISQHPQQQTDMPIIPDEELQPGVGCKDCMSEKDVQAAFDQLDKEIAGIDIDALFGNADLGSQKAQPVPPINPQAQ